MFSFKLKYLLTVCLILSSVSAFGGPVLRLSGIPDENPTELQRKFQPMVDRLQRDLGMKVEYVPVIDYGAAVAALAAGKIDFAWLGGFTYVQAKVMAGAQPVVMRDIDRQFTSVFVANAASGIHRVEDMKGKTFAFGSKSSTSGHLFPRHYLQTTYHIDPEKDFAGPPVFSGAHDATVKMVESGKVQAGAVNVEVWNRMVKEHQVDTNKVKVIWTTPQYCDYVWTARKDLAPEVVQKFATSFLTLDDSRPEDKKVLEVQGAKKFVRANPKDFEIVEQVARSTGLLK